MTHWLPSILCLYHLLYSFVSNTVSRGHRFHFLLPPFRVAITNQQNIRFIATYTTPVGVILIITSYKVHCKIAEIEGNDIIFGEICIYCIIPENRYKTWRTKLHTVQQYCLWRLKKFIFQYEHVKFKHFIIRYFLTKH